MVQNKNYTIRIQSNIAAPMSNGVLSIQHQNPMPGKRYMIEKLLITCATYNVDTAQFMNYDLVPDILTGLEVGVDAALGNLPIAQVFEPIAPFGGIVSNNGRLFMAYLKQCNEYDLSSLMWENTTYYYFRWINSTLNNLVFYYNIYSKLRFDE
jgi:hypothetical protein